MITYATPPIDYYSEARGKSGNDNWQDGQNIDVWEVLTYTDAACEHDRFDCDEVVLLYTGNIV
ncbi:hypothetical protein [Vibrio profundi]|uniref:hypothetical protein n=1 Tax=Vibrio profundi TaxID=1774960 RepID=UPI003735A921